MMLQWMVDVNRGRGGANDWWRCRRATRFSTLDQPHFINPLGLGDVESSPPATSLQRTPRFFGADEAPHNVSYRWQAYAMNGVPWNAGSPYQQTQIAVITACRFPGNVGLVVMTAPRMSLKGFLGVALVRSSDLSSQPARTASSTDCHRELGQRALEINMTPTSSGSTILHHDADSRLATITESCCTLADHIDLSYALLSIISIEWVRIDPLGMIDLAPGWQS